MQIRFVQVHKMYRPVSPLLPELIRREGLLACLIYLPSGGVGNSGTKYTNTPEVPGSHSAS
jgi:hypothetical protein